MRSIPFRETNYFSSFICDYLEEKPHLSTFYNRFPKLENFKEQIKEKQFSKTNRETLVKVLQEQYLNLNTSKRTSANIELLGKNNTYTITTGHQLNLFTGPLYFLYKILSTINLCEELSVKYPEQNFVPIYWMASEDHDFEEINFFNLKKKKIQWQRYFGGAVGEMSTEGLSDIFEIFSEIEIN